jgi:HPt (histidine-containing phosphotransfer) domain-containing protein
MMDAFMEMSHRHLKEIAAIEAERDALRKRVAELETLVEQHADGAAVSAQSNAKALRTARRDALIEAAERLQKHGIASWACEILRKLAEETPK